MYKEISEIKSVDEIQRIFKNHSFNKFFNDRELESVQNKNSIKSLGARYLIKKSILDYYKIENQYHNIEIENRLNGKPEVEIKGELKNLIKENIKISISHSRNFITTLVIIEHV